MRAAAVYDLFGQILLHEFFKGISVGENDPSTVIASLPEGQLSLADFIGRLNKFSDKALVETKRNANRALTRNLFKEVFRLTLAYSVFSNQRQLIKGESWFEFARIEANSLSHNFRLEFRRHDLAALPVTYGGVTIEASQNGKTIEMKLETLIGLVDEIIEFVNKRLK